MKKLISVLLVVVMVVTLAVTAGAVNSETDETTGYENSGYFFAQDARTTKPKVDGVKDDIYGTTPSFKYMSSGKGNQENVGNIKDTKNWLFTNGEFEDVSVVLEEGKYVEGYFAWDADYLYFYIEQDLGTFKQGQEPGMMWQDYCIQIEFIDFVANTYSDWGCSVLTEGDNAGDTIQNTFIGPTKTGAGNAAGGVTNYNVKVTATDTENGTYACYEGAVPVEDFFAKTEIKAGATLGFNLCINFGNISSGGKQKCLTWAADNYHDRKGNSAIPITLLGDGVTMEDALHAQEEADRMAADAAEETAGKGVLFDGCNDNAGWSGVSLDTEVKKAGSASFKFTLGGAVMGKTYSTGFDASDYDSVEFDFYIEDASALPTGGDSQFEISSAGKQDDNNEMHWMTKDFLTGLEDGWNHITLYLADGEVKGEFDQGNVNFIRWYWVSAENPVEAHWDNIRFTNARADKLAAESESLAKWEKQSQRQWERESESIRKAEEESLKKAQEEASAVANESQTELTNTPSETKKDNTDTTKKGCGSVIGAGIALVAVMSACGVGLVLKKKNED